MVNFPGFSPQNGTTPFNTDDHNEGEDDLPSLTFDEATSLVEEISQCAGWSAEIAASGMDDYEYITVQACFDQFGLVYQVDLENKEEWEYHRSRIEDWQKARKA